jgi:hypothetical protein
MTKVWNSFSILLVLAMLVFLAPVAVLLGPAVSVVNAAPITATTTELSVTFSISTPGTGHDGAWVAFSAGGSGAGSPYELEQFTRQVVQSGAAVPNSDFREFSYYTGTVSGDITGSAYLMFNSYCFATDYPYDPDYHSGTNFGFMSGRGYIDGSGSNDFYFIFVADLDGTDRFAKADGKGLMGSYDETGAYAGHKVIGSFDINISSNVYTGTMNLRDYPADLIIDSGVTHATGQVQTVNADDIAESMNLVYFNHSRGNYHTESSGFGDAGLDRIRRGQFAPQTVTSSSFGINGEIDNSRNAFLDTGQVFLGAQLEGVISGVNVYYDDRYVTTGDDGSTHGWIYQHLFLDMPYTEAGLGEWIFQTGYVMLNFEMYNQPTEDYTGGESFGENVMAFQAAFNPPYTSYSDTAALQLRPTPKLTSCNPSSGYTGETLNVTVPGKYFLRHSDFVSGSSIDFGAGITVNDWWVDTTNPIDNNVTVSITIDGAAAPGTRDINMTACYGLGSPDPSNHTGILADGFTVVFTPAVGVSPLSGLVTTEEGGNDTYTMVLNDNPGTTVTIDISSDDTSEGTVSPSKVVFGSGNWSTPQTITVTGVDDTLRDGNIVYHAVNSNTASSNASWDDLNVPDVTVTNIDSDAYKLTVSVAGNGTTTPPAGVHWYPIGANVTLTANPDPGNDFVNWSLSNLTTDITLFSERFPNAVNTWTGTNQDESWSVVTVSEAGDIDISSNAAAAGSVPPSGHPELSMEDCDDAWGTGDIVWAAVDLAGYYNVAISYYWQLDTTDANEGFRSAYSTNAVGGRDADGTWNLMYAHYDNPEDTWTKDTYNLPNASCVSNFKFRFNAYATAADEESFIDDVLIIGDIGESWTTTDNPTYIVMNLNNSAAEAYFNYSGVQTANITGTVYEANTSVVSGADVVLKLSGSPVDNTTTNASGYYTFSVNATGNYRVNVTKAGITYAEKWANVTVLGDDVTCDFKGMDAPYRTAPDGLYVIKCSNLWLWGGGYPPGFALDATRVSDVLYAWTHPS